MYVTDVTANLKQCVHRWYSSFALFYAFNDDRIIMLIKDVKYGVGLQSVICSIIFAEY
jgi:hypothetical protein